MFCPNCGKQVEDNDSFCPECGCNLKNPKFTQDTATANTQKFDINKHGSNEGLTAMICGIVSFILPLFIGFVLAILAIDWGKKNTRSKSENDYGNVAHIIGWVSFALHIVAFIVLTLYVVLMPIVYGSAIAS